MPDAADAFLTSPDPPQGSPPADAADAFLRSTDDKAGAFLKGEAPAKTGFWANFGEQIGGINPFTRSLPAELLRGPLGSMASPDAATRALAIERLREFFQSPNTGKPWRQQLTESFSSMAHQVSERGLAGGSGYVAGTILASLANDPELFFIPGATEARAGEAAVKAATALGAGAKAAKVAETVGRAGGAVTTAAGIGGGAELARQMAEDEHFNPGAVAASAGIATLAAPFQLPTRSLRPKMPLARADEIIGPSVTAEASPKVEVFPTADGYGVRMEGSPQVGENYQTKAEAEGAAQDLERLRSAYRVSGAADVSRGTADGASAADRTRLLIENPFTEQVAGALKESLLERPDPGAARTGSQLLRMFRDTAIASGIGAAAGATLDKENRGEGALFGATFGLGRLLPADWRLSIAGAINLYDGLVPAWLRRTFQFKTAIETQVPEPLRRNAISIAMEGGPAGAAIKLNPAEAGVARSARAFFAMMGRTAQDAGILKELLHDYVPHIVARRKDSEKAIDGLIDRLMNRPGRSEPTGKQFTKPRQYPTFGELMEALRGSNLEIKTGDIAEILAQYSKAMFTTITRRRLLDALKQTFVRGGAPEVLAPKAAAAHGGPALERGPLEGEASAAPGKLPRGNLPAAATPKGMAGSRGATGNESAGAVREGFEGGFRLPPEPPPGITARKAAAKEENLHLVETAKRAPDWYVSIENRQFEGLKVHPDIAPQLRFVFDAQNPSWIRKALEMVNQAQKRVLVSFSIFHAKTLAETFSIAATPKMLLNTKTLVRRAMAQYEQGGGPNDPVEQLIKAGLKLRAPEETETDSFHDALERAAAIIDRVLPVHGAATKAAGAVEKYNRFVDNATFGTLQTAFKIIIATDAQERLVRKGLPSARAAELAASYTNDLFGSLDWFRLTQDVGSRIGRDIAYGFFSPTGRRWMQLMMFAPDWTFATFRSLYNALPGAVDDPALAALHRRYLGKAALYYLTIANAVNLMTVGHSIFENENPTRIQLKDGRTLQFAKHVMEPLEWLRDPVQSADNKFAFWPRTLVTFGTGKEYISAYDRAPDVKSRAELIAQQFLPIPAQQGLAGGGALSASGILGFPVYGKTPDQRREARIEKRRAERAKRRSTAEYLRELNQ